MTVLLLPILGREFMPAVGRRAHLDSRHLSGQRFARPERPNRSRLARAIMRKYPEVELVVCQLGRPDSGVDPTGFYSAEFFVPLKPQENWPADGAATGWRRWLGRCDPRTKPELVAARSAPN